MIIHNPEITGSLSFPREDGTKVVIKLSSQGGLETVVADATGSVTGTPQSNFSGSFTGSFVGDGSQITGVAASSINIDLFNDGTVAGDDNILFSDTDDSGTEKKGTFKSGLNSETVVSGSSQVSFTTISDKPTLVSGSSQVDVEQTTNFSTFSSSIASTFSGLSSDFADLQNKPTLVSGSGQIVLENADKTGFTGASSITTLGTVTAGSVTAILPSGTVSGSSQISFTTISDKPTLVSGSGQIVLQSADKTGFTGASSITTVGTVTAGSVTAILPTGVVSGSSQVNADSITNFDTNVKDKLNTETVVSGSTQILTLVSIDEDNMVSNSDTKLPTQQSVKSYVDGEITALISGSPATLDTLNELAAALGDDPNFATTVSTTIGGKVSQSLEIISGNGLTGGGNLTTNRTLAVGGTTDRISVTADAVDIASTYVGQSSITTLGTITTGTWQGTAIASAYLDADTAHLTETQTFSGAKTFSAAVSITDSTASTSKTTGALIVTGGIGTSGDVFAGGDVVAYASSDERLKKNIEIISNPIQKVQQLKGVTWNWKNEASEAQKATPAIGVIAQDVEKVLPQLVDTRENGYKAVDYGKLTGLLIEAIKEQQKQIDELKSRLR
jgi:hypothetical protein